MPVVFIVLQWGRNFIVAETATVVAGGVLIMMGLQWGRNFIVAEIKATTTRTTQAGALQWGRNFIVAEMPNVYASHSSESLPLQWGRNFIVAEIGKDAGVWQHVDRLQWGRNFIVAEIRGLCDVAGLGGPASMGPQLYRCGNDLGAGLGVESHKCFNGAATLSLWKRAILHGLSIAVFLLQWGRNFIVAEIIRRNCMWSSFISLQWGRNFIVAETTRSQARTPSLQHASMGPQLYRCGNSRSRTY